MNTENSKEALEYLVELGKDEFQIFTAENGFQYTTQEVYRMESFKPSPIKSSTLTSLVDYIKSDMDNLGRILIQIGSPTEVSLLSDLKVDSSRNNYMQCNAITPRVTFNSFLDTESFNIMLQSSFVRNNDIEQLLIVTGNIKEETVKQTGDDGISQSVVIKTGVASMQSVVIPNQVNLAPFRTFPEIEQPESKFVFRMKSGPTATLIEADGGAWRNKAMEDIKGYLKIQLEGVTDLTIIS